MHFTDLVALNLHDLKNRLAMVAARAERRGDTETVHDVLAVTAELIRLLACYKAEAGQLKPAIDAYCPQYLIEELVADYRKLGGLVIETDATHAPTSWYYDEDLIRLVLVNALQNALRHARTRVRVSVLEDGDWLEFRIHDDGPGYPDVLLQPTPATTDATPLSRDGTGVGLYLAHRVAALHENHGLTGEVLLENDTNDTGAVFRLRLPV